MSTINGSMFVISFILLFCIKLGVICNLNLYESVDERENVRESVRERERTRLNPKFVSKWLDEYFKVSGNRVPPRMFIEWIKLASENNCSIRPSDYGQIFSDLKPFKMAGSSFEYLKVANDIIKAYGREKEVVLLNRQDLVTNSDAFIAKHFGNSLDLIKFVLNPDVNFGIIFKLVDEPMVIPSDDHSFEPYTDMNSVFERSSIFKNLHEEYRQNNSLLSVPNSFVAIPIKFPIMSVNRMRGFFDIVLPTKRTGLSAFSKDHRELALSAPHWNEKINRAIFRGSSTGINFRNAKMKNIDLITNARFKLYEMTRRQQNNDLNCTVLLDFGISKYQQYTRDYGELDNVLENYPEVPSMNLAEQFRSKYLVIVDGNGWPDRVAGFMLSGSLIFLATLHEDWVINQLIDGVHYIQIKPDLSDLIEKLEWAAENDAKAKEIAENGKIFASSKFDATNMQVYNAFLLMEYQNLFTK